MKNKRRNAILVLVAVGCIIMAVVDAFIRPGYITKSVLKLILFLALPCWYAFSEKEIRLIQLFSFRKKRFLRAVLYGVAVYGFIIGCYYLMRPFFDFSHITAALSKDNGVHSDNFIFVALYISFINSLLEEFFFRGFAFLIIKKYWKRKAAYFFSALMFAFYHIAMMIGWMSAGLTVLLIAGLFAAGLFFNFLDERDGNLYPSWAFHMFANFAINTIGFLLFGMI
ncbi:MAG: CPBP family intramembrane metalloprotease [Clostridiales bacterium]|nr:CPBP family intramembrane metalloprotease [Clostridiales bacterium]